MPNKLDILKTALAYELAVIAEHPRRIADVDATWHWPVVPEQTLFECGYITDFTRHREKRKERRREHVDKNAPYVNPVRDFGFDGLARNRDGTFSGIQAKHYTVGAVCASDIGSFLVAQMSVRIVHPTALGYLYTVGRLQRDLANRVADPAFPVRHIQFSPPTESSTTPTIAISECDLKLREYQTEALADLASVEHGHQVLNVPCRMGKSILAGHHLRRLAPNLVLVMAPLRISVENLHQRLPPFMPTASVLVVDSDKGGTTDPDEIRAHIAAAADAGVPVMLCATFRSGVDVLAPLLSDTQCSTGFCLIDECHNATAEVFALAQRFTDGLLMSATIPEELYDAMDVVNTVKVSFERGIREGYLVDFTVWLPHLITLEDGRTAVDSSEIPVEFAAFSSDLTAKAMYNCVGMLKTGSQRCIAYLASREECAAYVAVVRAVLETYHGFPSSDVWTGVIVADVGRVERERLLREFQENEGRFSILASVRILDESVDIPRCDMVFVTVIGEQSSDIRMVQRALRGSTVDPRNSSKRNHVLLWSDGLERCVGALSLLREMDPEFHRKVRILDARYDESGAAERISAIASEQTAVDAWIGMRCQSLWDRHVAMVAALKAFYETWGEGPKQGGKRNGEKRLAKYSCNVRHRKKKGLLAPTVDQLLLQECPWFSWDPFEDEFRLTCENARDFHAKFGEGPKHCGTREGETILAIRLNNIRQSHKKGTLSDERKSYMESMNPWFSWNPYLDGHRTIIQQIKAHYAKTGKAPRRRRDEESNMERWICDRRIAKKSGKLDAELATLIATELPWLVL